MTYKKRIMFKGFWNCFNKKNNMFTIILNMNNADFEIVDEDPDIIIFSVFGKEQYRYNIDFSKKNIFYTGESYLYLDYNTPFIKNIELNLTSEHITQHNNIRFPVWLPFYIVRYGSIFQRNNVNFSHETLTLTKKNTNDFCCFVYSNNIDFRNNFCKKLSQYKKIDCGGDCLNNVNGKVKDKIQFQRKYKFCIAYENTIHDGYTTEKIFESYLSNCIPIYYGSKSVALDFNPETFINAHDFNNDEDLIEYIKEVDNNVDLYNSYLNKPIFSKKWLDIFNDPEKTFFKTISQKILHMNLNIIIPVRNREQELKEIIKNLSEILTKQNIKFHFFVIYQNDNKLFNKGILNNIGFLYAKDKNTCNNFLFNDVNVYPRSPEIYNFNYIIKSNEIYNPYGYHHCLARFFMTQKSTFEKLNGYSNMYNGWGYEDTDLQRRAMHKNVNINRNIFWKRTKMSRYFVDSYINSREKMRIAEKTTKITYYNKWDKKNQKDIDIEISNDGLTCINLKNYVISTEDGDNITKVFVEI